MAQINEFEQIRRNFWRKDEKSYRLFAYGITPNGCWLISPEMREIVDIDIATGNDIYGEDIIEFEYIGTVPASFQYLPKTK